MRIIKHISLNITEEIKKILPNTLEKDLQDDEIICPVCNGLGIIKQDYRFGMKENDTDKAFKLNWYDNEYLTLCPHCYFGRLKTCKHCGKPLQKQTNRCSCDGYREQEAEENRIKYQKTIGKAKEIELKDASYYMYDEQSKQYFSDENEFVEYYYQEWFERYSGGMSFNAYFDSQVPKVLWNCEVVKSQWMQTVLLKMPVKNYMRMQEIIFPMRKNCKKFLISGARNRLERSLIILAIRNM